MAKEYQGSATGGAFSPNKTLRTGDNSKENENRFASTLADYGQIQSQNDRTYIDNAAKNTKGWNELAKFSNKLTERIVKDRQAKNLEEYEAGIADAYLNGIPQEEAEAFDKQEAAINAVGQETDALGAEYAELSGSRSQGEQISASSGWRALGRATGMAKQGAAQYPLFIAMNAERLAGATTPQEYAATLAELRKEYTGQFSGMNRAMMGKYMFPKMQEFEASQFLSWQEKNNEMIMNDRVEEMGNDFYTDVTNGSGGEAFVNFLEKNKHFLKGYGNARIKLFEVIEQGIRSGKITRDQADNLRGHRFNFNGKETTLGAQFAKDFDALADIHDNEAYQTYQQGQQRITIKKGEIIANIRKWQSELGRKMTNEEKQKLIAEWPVELGNPDEINDMLTVEDQDEKSRLEYLKAKIQSNAQITEQDLIGIPADQRQRYAGFVTPAVTENRTQGKSIVEGYVTESIAGQTGQTDKSGNWHDTNLNAQASFNAAYSRYIAGGAKPQDALKSALIDVKTGLANKSINHKLDTSGAKESYTNINEAMKVLKEDPNAYTTTVLPGSEKALEQLEQQIKTSQSTGKAVTIPQFYHTIASGMKGISGWDLANQQSILNGGSGLQKPQAEQLIDSLPPDYKEWMTYKPTPSRAVRTMTATGDSASFLNLIAGVESAGDYDAFNLGGSNEGHTAHGSGFGNDATARWGKQLTQMTVGEVLDHGFSHSSEGRWVHAAGRYQIIPGTLRGLVENYGIDKNALYDPAMQDHMAMLLAYQRLVRQNKISGLRTEWVGLNNVSAGEIQQSLGAAFNNPQLLLKGV